MQFNTVLTMLNFPACAEALQGNGITVLLYDPRNTGSSDGQPRNDIDPPQSVSDLSDALTHLMTLSSVDPSQTGLLGFSFGGTVALCAAAVDPRCCFVVAVAPLTDLDFTSSKQRLRVLRKCAQDRESQAMGNDAFMLPLINEQGENPVGFGHGIDKEQYAKLVSRGKELAPGHVNRITLMSYYKIAMWTPWSLWKHLELGYDEDGGVRGVMFVIPGKDTVSYPELQRQHYRELSETVGIHKRKLEIEGVGHEEILGEKCLNTITEGIRNFIKGLAGNDS